MPIDKSDTSVDCSDATTTEEMGLFNKIVRRSPPLDTNTSSVHYNTQQVSLRLEEELGKGQTMFIDGCPRDWEKLPRPNTPINRWY